MRLNYRNNIDLSVYKSYGNKTSEAVFQLLKSLFNETVTYIRIPMGDVPYELIEFNVNNKLKFRLLLNDSGYILTIKYPNGWFWTVSSSDSTKELQISSQDIKYITDFIDSCPDTNWVPENKFITFSNSTGAEYETDTEKVTCTCRDFTYRRSHLKVDTQGRQCKHLQEVFSTYPELLPKILLDAEKSEGKSNRDNDGKVRYPRAMFDPYIADIRSVLEQFKDIVKIYQVCGSYRRLAKTVSDLDILVQLVPGTSWDGLLDYLENTMGYQLISDIGRGDAKAAYMIDGFVHVDFKCVAEENWPFALMHFTGSKDTNIYMRRRANQLGYKLNEYGLYKDSDGSRVEGLVTEEDIYKFLKVNFQQPWER